MAFAGVRRSFISRTRATQSMALHLARIVARRRLCFQPRAAILVATLSPQWQQQKRSFFGLGELVGVIANPAETLRQLNESRDLLKKAKEDLELSNEAKKIPKKHTFSKLPGFHGRKEEQALLRKILSNTPKLSVIFGATSVGKTALLREVLATDDFFVIKFDLRISGFADLRTLYLALCEQFQQFFEEMKDEEMDKQRLVFKHLILELGEKEKAEGGYEVSVADIAGLMESLQSCLLRYWEYDPAVKEASKDEDNAEQSDQVLEEKKQQTRKVEVSENKTQDDQSSTQNTGNEKEEVKDGEEGEEEEKVFKKRPLVFLMDEAHKLPALVNDQLCLKVFLDTILVLTKQDRLCHVIFSTSDSFFHHFLRSMNVGHHAQLMTIGDCTKDETRSYFQDELLPTIPDNLKAKINFDEIYEAFGGKLSHISDYVSAWVNADGEMTPYTSAIFTQAYTLLQFHTTHDNFETFSPLSTATAGSSSDDDTARFTREDLFHVMKQLVKPPYSLPYFRLCREVGTEQVDSMIKTRILDLRWTRTVTPEQDWAERVWSKDGIERPIVLPMTTIVRRAMEVLFREEEEYKKSGMFVDNPSRKRQGDEVEDVPKSG